jgi:hypothetical protein
LEGQDVIGMDREDLQVELDGLLGIHKKPGWYHGDDCQECQWELKRIEEIRDILKGPE